MRLETYLHHVKYNCVFIKKTIQSYSVVDDGGGGGGDNMKPTDAGFEQNL